MEAGLIGAIEAGSSVGSAVASASRQCTIEVLNECTNYSLCNPRTHIESGRCAIPLSPFIAPSKAAAAQFIKTSGAARGSVGVFTYDLLKKDEDQPCERMAVMFSVPYDFNLYSNWYAVGIFEKSKACDCHLYDEMYNNTDKSFIRGKASAGKCLIYKGDHVTIMATMSDSYQPVIKLQVSDKLQNITF